VRRLAALAVLAAVALAGCGDSGTPAGGDASETHPEATLEPVTDTGTAATYTTALTGAAEVPGPGDPDATGEASVMLAPGRGEVCLALTVEGLEPTGVHLQEGPPGESGPVVLGLPVPGDGVDGCASADEQLLVRLAKDPGDFYVNVHSAEVPEGAVRGQLG
jgi:hypothetical protein